MKCIYETFLHSSTSFDGFNVQIPHRSFRKDHLSNNKHVWVLIHCKIFLLIQQIDIASSTELYVLILKLEEKHEDFWPFLDPYSSVVNCKGVGQIVFLKDFSLLKAFFLWPTQIKEFPRKSYSPFNYHPLIFWNFLVKFSSAKWKPWVRTKWENCSEHKQS